MLVVWVLAFVSGPTKIGSSNLRVAIIQNVEFGVPPGPIGVYSTLGDVRGLFLVIRIFFQVVVRVIDGNDIIVIDEHVS
jgi:hypothetical protein